jgi:hypothetical protein
VKLAVGLLVFAACAADDGPTITSLSPAAARHTQVVMIVGENLCAGVETCHGLGGMVQIGLGSPSYQAPPFDVTDEMWKFQVPDIVPIGEIDLLIAINGRSSNSFPFEVLP